MKISTTQRKLINQMLEADGPVNPYSLGASAASVRSMHRNGIIRVAADPATYVLTSYAEEALAAGPDMVDMGTCQVCFREFKLTAAGNVGRHGWQGSGGRRLGEYGNAWHSGGCYAAKFAPFEDSCERTESYLEDVLQPALQRAEEWRAKLDTSPPLTTDAYECPRTGVVTERGGWGKPSTKRPVTLLPVTGRPAYDTQKELWHQRRAYIKERGYAVRRVEQDIGQIKLQLSQMKKAIADWKPGKTRMVER